MIIHKLHLISFGKFKNKTVSLEKGLNYIYGENEAGKSTLMAFIKAMLYGFTGRGADGDRQRYSPWDGAKLAGEMEVTLSDGRRVVICRSQGKTKAQDTCSILDAVTGEECKADLESEIGIGEAAFMKTVFIPQMRADISGGDAELTEKLLNLATSGDADTGYEEASKYLADAMRLLKHKTGSGGRINDLKREITELSAHLAEAEAELKTYFRYVGEEKKLFLAVDALKKETESLTSLLEGAKAGMAASALQKAKDEALLAEEKLREAEQNLSAAKERQKALSVFRNEMEEAVFGPSENTEPMMVQERRAEKNKTVFSALSLLLAVASVVAALFRVWIPLIGLLPAAAVCVFLGIKAGKLQKVLKNKLSEIQEKERKNKEALASFGCRTLREYTEKRAELLALDGTLHLLEEKYAFALADAELKKNEEKRLSAISLSFKDVAPTDTPETEIAAKLQEANMALAEKERALLTARGVLQGASEGKKAPDLIVTEITCKKEELAEAERQFSALELASETLEEVFRQLSQDFTPRINQKASSYLSVLTGNEESLLLDKKYAVTMGRDGHRPLQAFSGGTAEQAFLAVRLAIASLVLDDATIPVFLDDAFVHYDAKREENAFSLLREIAKEKQVILFSCRRRETESAHTVEL